MGPLERVIRSLKGSSKWVVKPPKTIAGLRKKQKLFYKLSHVFNEVDIDGNFKITDTNINGYRLEIRRVMNRNIHWDNLYNNYNGPSNLDEFLDLFDIYDKDNLKFYPVSIRKYRQQLQFFKDRSEIYKLFCGDDHRKPFRSQLYQLYDYQSATGYYLDTHRTFNDLAWNPRYAVVTKPFGKHCLRKRYGFEFGQAQYIHNSILNCYISHKAIIWTQDPDDTYQFNNNNKSKLLVGDAITNKITNLRNGKNERLDLKAVEDDELESYGMYLLSI